MPDHDDIQDPTAFQVILPVPPDIDTAIPGDLVCAFSGSARPKFDTMGRMVMEIAVDPVHSWTALLLKDLRGVRLNFLVYVEDPDAEIGPEAVQRALTEIQNDASDVQWKRVVGRFLEGSEGDD